MLLTIDLGNSRIKLASWQGDQITHRYVFEYSHPGGIDEVFEAIKDIDEVHAITVSSVLDTAEAGDLDSVIAKRGLPRPVYLQSTSSCCGVQHAYDDPSTHGTDRWAAIIAAHHLHQGVVCVIDAGSAVTFDVVDGAGRHLGGCIAPGSGFDAGQLLARFAAGGFERPASLLANNTREAVVSGCAAHAEGGIEYIVKAVSAELGEHMHVMLTGGDAQYIAQELTADWSLSIQPDLVMHGLQIYSEMNC